MQQIQSADFRIMHLPKERLRNLQPVTSLDVYESGTDNFHENGLFSTTIFGRVGDPLRDRRFSYIDCKIEVLHPLLFKNLIKLKKFYGEIIRGNAYAVFDDELKDFVPSDILDGQTGYNFFLSHFDDLVFQRNKSIKRDEYINLIEKYRAIAKTSNILVLPAGLRDLEIQEDGRDKEGEVNEYYRKILSVANTLSSKTDLNTSLTDNARLSIQNAFNSIYAYFIQLIKGKGGLILRKWARRKVFNSTRTVLTAKLPNIKDVNSDEHSTWLSVDVGIAQVIKAVLPVATHKLLNHQLILDAFGLDDGNAYLLNPKTLIRERVNVSSKILDRWTTANGTEELFDTFMDHTVRSSPITIDGHYLGLIYRDNKNGFKIISDITEADNYPWMDKSLLYPITYVELFYLMNYQEWNRYPSTNTRYPVSGAGSIFPAMTFCKTTVSSEVRYELDDEGNNIPEMKAISFPILKDAVYIDTVAQDSSRLGGLLADFDGDTMSYIALCTEDAINEINEYLNTAAAYLGIKGLLNSPYTDPINRVIINMTGDPE